MKTFHQFRSILVAALVFSLFACPLHTKADDQELRDLDVSAWPCLNRAEGAAKTPEASERNRMKNRGLLDLSGVKVEALETAGFLQKVREFDSHLSSRVRKDLTAAERATLEGYEKQVVSLTGWLVLAYPGQAESTNCGDPAIHDWHLEIAAQNRDHQPEKGDPTPIICEITPRTERSIYRANIRLQALAGFLRNGKSYVSTGHPARLIRVTGTLLWDDEHNGEEDIGSAIDHWTDNGYHHPWRSTAWEIHPITKVELLSDQQQQPATKPPATPEAKP